MKSSQRRVLLATLASAAALVACGGSSDDGAGSPVALNATPSNFTLTAPTGSACPATPTTVRVFINGGTAPYTIANPYDNWLAVSTGTVSNRGGSFVVSFLGGCLSVEGETSGILVRDARGAQTYVAVNYEEGT